MEISGVFNWQQDDLITIAGPMKQIGVSNTQIGLRYNILQRKGAIPAVGIQGRLLLKAQSKTYQREKTGAKFILATGNKITDWLSVGTNWMLTWTGNAPTPQGSYVLNLSFSIDEKWGSFAEIYGNLNNFDTNFDAGFSYLVNNDLQLDASAGWQGQEALEDWFIDFGVSWRWHDRD